MDNVSHLMHMTGAGNIFSAVNIADDVEDWLQAIR